MEQNNYLDIIEGMLYLAGDDGVDIKQVAGVLEISKKEATLLMDQFTEIYGNKALKGIVLVNFGGRYKLATNADYFIYYQKMVEQSSASLSNAALETLAIIAYNQPITRAGVEDIRGVGCDAMIRKLVAKALIKEVGREDTPGMPILYGVTDGQQHGNRRNPPEIRKCVCSHSAAGYVCSHADGYGRKFRQPGQHDDYPRYGGR